MTEKEVLAQPEPSELDIWKVRALQAEAVIEKFMAQSEQEPVRVMGFNCVCGRRMEVSAEQGVVPAPQPVIDKSAAIRIATSLGWTPQRTWVGLTDVLDFIEEFTGAERERHPMFSDGYDLALSHVKELVEAKLKEKNT